MNDDFDTRARAAATALHDSVRELPVTTPLRQGGRSHVVLAVAAVALLIAGLAVVLRDEGPSETDVVTDDPDVPRFILDTPPAGVLPTGVADLSSADTAGPTQTYWLYGDPEAADPFAGGDLGVVIMSSTGLDISMPDTAAPVEPIDGRPAWLDTDPFGSGRRAVIIDGDEFTAFVSGSGLADAELIEIADELDFDPAADDAPAALGGLRRVAVGTGALTPIVPPLPLPAAIGHIAGYQSQDGAGARTIRVASVAGGEDAYLVARWALGGDGRSVRIRGTDGWAGSVWGGTTQVVVWRESARNLVVVMADGLGEDAALDSAAGLRPATDDEWAELLRTTGRVSAPRSALAAVAGDDGGDSSYVAYIDADRSLCLDVETADGSSGTCSGPGDEPIAVGVGTLANGAPAVYGYTTLGTGGEVRITTEGPDGSVGSAGSEAYYDGGTVFAFAVTDGVLPTEIVVQSADGTELGRAEVPPVGLGSSSGVATTTPPSGQ